MAYISVITDEENSLTKHFALGEDGKLIKTAPGHLVKGTIEAFDVNTTQLITLIKGLQQNQCLCLGVLDSPECQDIFCKKLAGPGQPTRSKEFLNFFPGNSFLLLDFDDCGKTPEEALEILSEIDTQFASCGVAVIPSSSSYLYADDKEVVGVGNFHIFVELTGTRDPNEYGEILFNRLLLKGFVEPKISKAGAVMIKSLVDKVVWSCEREIFSADPVCDPPLRSERLKHISWQEGPALDSDLMPELSDDERMDLRMQLKAIRDELMPQAEKQRKAYYVELAKKRAKVTGSGNYLKELPHIADTPIFYDKQGRPVMELLSDDHIMQEDGSMIQVRDFLLNPREGGKLPDPIEPYKRGDEKKGIPGRGIATVLGNIIYSHHHCGVIYLLKWSASDAIDYLTGIASPEEKALLWTALSKGTQELSASTTDAELSELADTFKRELHGNKAAKIGKEKKHILAKLQIPYVPAIAEVDKILEMNAKYGIVNMSGKVCVVTEKWNASAGEFNAEFMLPVGMDTLTKNIPMRIPGMAMPVSLYRYWEQHPDRRTYEDAVFEPNAHTFRLPGKPRCLPSTEYYNLFQGYMYDPSRATNCEMVLNHIKDVWCSGNEDEYNYTIGWLAHMFQHPEELSQTALVLQSVPGAGKGIIIENCIVKTLGVHAISTSRSDDLVGKFNAHLGLNIFFYANEMEYTAQNSVKSMLKTVVETDTRTIEYKNINKIKSRNHTSLIISTNGEWVLNIDHNDRRYVYLTVSAHKVGDRDYFIRLAKCINDGGKEAFIKYLLNYDLSNYKANVIPDRLHHQRVADFLRSSHPIVKFIWSLFDTDFGVAHLANDPSYKSLKEWQERGDEEIIFHKAQLFSLYREYCEYYKIDRKYDDSGSIAMHMEVGGVLKRESDPRDEFVLRRGRKDKKEVYILKSVNDGKLLLKV